MTAIADKDKQDKLLEQQLKFRQPYDIADLLAKVWDVDQLKRLGEVIAEQVKRQASSPTFPIARAVGLTEPPNLATRTNDLAPRSVTLTARPGTMASQTSMRLPEGAGFSAVMLRSVSGLFANVTDVLQKGLHSGATVGQHQVSALPRPGAIPSDRKPLWHNDLFDYGATACVSAQSPDTAMTMLDGLGDTSRNYEETMA
jgi:hypothetical protein